MLRFMREHYNKCLYYIVQLTQIRNLFYQISGIDTDLMTVTVKSKRNSETTGAKYSSQG